MERIRQDERISLQQLIVVAGYANAEVVGTVCAAGRRTWQGLAEASGDPIPQETSALEWNGRLARPPMRCAYVPLFFASFSHFYYFIIRRTCVQACRRTLR